jgi:hypothetical protein
MITTTIRIYGGNGDDDKCVHVDCRTARDHSCRIEQSSNIAITLATVKESGSIATELPEN